MATEIQPDPTGGRPLSQQLQALSKTLADAFRPITQFVKSDVFGRINQAIERIEAWETSSDSLHQKRAALFDDDMPVGMALDILDAFPDTPNWHLRPGESRRDWQNRPEVWAEAKRRGAPSSKRGLAGVLAQMGKEQGFSWNSETIRTDMRDM